MPVPPTSRYFHDASNARAVPLKCSSGTVTSVVASAATQSRPRFCACNARLNRPSITSSAVTKIRFFRSARICKYVTA